MRVIPYKRVRVSKDNRIWVSCYPEMQSFEVFEELDPRFGLTEFIPIRYPGCGFFVRVSNSQLYLRNVRACQAPFARRYCNLLFPQLPSFGKLISQGERAVANSCDRLYGALFESYVDILMLVRERDRLVRIVKVLRRQRHGSSGAYTHPDLMDCKRSIRGIEARIRMAAFDMSSHYRHEVMEAYIRLVDSFQLLSSIHHIWDMHLRSDVSEHGRVFFDLGAMNYVCTPVPLPLMRDSRGRRFYILPDRMLCFRTPFDFDTVMLRDMDIRFGILDGSRQSELSFSELELRYRFGGVRRVEQFVQTWQELRSLSTE